MIGLAAALLAAGPRPAAAGEGEVAPERDGAGDAATAVPDDIVGILSLEAEGVSDAAAEKLEAGIEDGLAGTTDGDRPRVATRQRLNELLARSSFAPGCLFGPCLEEIYRNTQVRMVLVARIVGNGQSYDFLVSLMNTRSGLLMSQVATRCAVCTLDEAITSATLATIELITRAESSEADAVATAGAVTADLGLTERVAAKQRSMRRTGVFFLAAAVLAGGAGAYFAGTDQGDVGYPLLAAGGSFAVTSTALFLLARRF